ncbi:MAG: ABC transporter substrate-binding protein [Thermoplasmata archaeon]|nr:ABC transporter substrate-binding protein [Thermoplasmata archaeon]
MLDSSDQLSGDIDSSLDGEPSNICLSDHLRTITSVFIAGMFFLTIFQMALSGIAMAAPEDRVFTIGMGESVTSANPYIGLYDSDYLFYSYVYDYLIFPNEDGEYTPNLAKSWYFLSGDSAAASGSDFSQLKHNQSPSDWPLGSIWQYNLTENVFWSDGVPFSADDVVFTINMQIGPNFNTYWAYQPYSRWIDYAEKINESTVRVFFADFDSKIPIPIAWGESISIPMMPKHVFEGRPSTYIAIEWKGVPAIGTGPFMGTDLLEQEVIQKESLTVAKNPFYDFMEDGVRKGLGGYFNRTIEIDKLIMKFFSEQQTLILNLRTGGLDAAKITPGNYLAIQDDPNAPQNLKLVSTYSCTVYTTISHWNVYKDAPAAELHPMRLDPAVQRATAIATDKNLINQAVFKGFGTPGYHLISPVYPQWYWEPGDDEISYFNVTNADDNIVYSYNATLKHVMDYNITRANEILDAAGYTWQNTSEENIRVVGQQAAARLKNLGIITVEADAIGKRLEIYNTVEQEVPEDKAIGQYLMSLWKDIGISVKEKLVNVALWGQVVYSYEFDFTMTYWSGDVDPNYLLYVPTSYAMWGWNEFGTTDAEYDHAYDMQARIFDYDERMTWVEKCCKITYLWGHLIVTSYPKACFGYNEDKWTNWGNWTEHPGLAIDHFWGESPLFYHIKWSGSSAPGTGDPLPIIIAVVVIAGIAVATIWMMMSKKKKMKELLEEEEEK